MSPDSKLRILEHTLIWGFVLMMVTGLLSVLRDWVDMPIVERDRMTGECVRVDDRAHPNSGLTCQHLPEKYFTRTVEHVRRRVL